MRHGSAKDRLCVAYKMTRKYIIIGQRADARSLKE